MRKDRLYLFTFLAITVLFLIISSISIGYFVDTAANKVLETQLEFSKREAKQVAKLVGYQLQNGIAKDITIRNTQLSIENSNLEIGFVSVFDWSGKIVCHPDMTQIGQPISAKESFVNSLSDELTSTEFYELLKSAEGFNEDLDDGTSLNSSEVVYLYPVPNSDWIVAAHANTQKVSSQIGSIRQRFLIILLIMGFVFILSSVVIVRLIGSNYEKNLEVKNQQLSDEVINLAKLNSDVTNYQQRVIEKPDTPDMKNNDEAENTTKKRILTYVRHELVPIAIEEISHIYTENTITYVVGVDGKRSTTNASLDELYSNLDNTIFFRANRQFIIAIAAIDKIVRYGNNQLKILIKPNSDVDIIISKNRAAEFKQWLNL